MSNTRIKNLPTLNRALAEGDVLAIDGDSGSAKVDFTTLKQQVNGITLVAKSITSNGYYDPADDDADGYSSVNVNVGGSGSSGVYVGTSDPSSSLGSDGEYYYKRALLPNDVQAFPQTSVSGNSQQSRAGYKFTALTACKVVGLCGRVVGTAIVDLTLQADDGTVIAKIESATIGSTWTTVMLDTPVVLTAGQDYIVTEARLTSSPIVYFSATPSSAVTDPRIQYVTGKYGNSFPYNNDNDYRYSADIVLENAMGEVYEVIKQYYKSNGAWVVIA